MEIIDNTKATPVDNKSTGDKPKDTTKQINQESQPIETTVIEMSKDKEPLDLEPLRKVEDDSVLYNIKKASSGAPTYNPTSYKEQFYFQDDGSMWANINNTWRKIGGGGIKSGRVYSYYSGDPRGYRQSVTGIGFKPRVINLIAGYGYDNPAPSTSQTMSWGTSEGPGTDVCQRIYFWETMRVGSGSTLVYLEDAGGNTLISGFLYSFDDDGFTIEWNQASMLGVPLQYQCFE